MRVGDWGWLPDFQAHLMRMRHAGARAGISNRSHWIRSWAIEKSAQWEPAELVIASANPVLGAILAARSSQKGIRSVWFFHEEPDAWDYKLFAMGAHDEELAKAGLPKAGPKFFERLARQATLCRMAWDCRWQYEYAEEGANRSLFFAKPEAPKASPESQSQCSRWWRQAGGKLKRWEPLRQRSGEWREMIVWAPTLELGSRYEDGALIAAQEEGWSEFKQEEGRLRAGSARWSTKGAEMFAKKSREDLIKLLGETR